jgi:hypothetical protein
MVHNFRQILETKGYNYLFYEWHEGHSWGNWRAHIDNALQFFFPHTNSVYELNIDSPIKLEQNYPNPASSTTTISFSGLIGSIVELSLLDETGSVVTIIWSGKIVQENNQFEFDVRSLRAGIYYLSVTFNGRTLVKKLVVK